MCLLCVLNILFYAKDLGILRIFGRKLSVKIMERIVGHQSVIESSYESTMSIRTNRVLVSVLDFKVKTPTIGLEFIIRGRQGKDHIACIRREAI